MQRVARSPVQFVRSQLNRAARLQLFNSIAQLLVKRDGRVHGQNELAGARAPANLWRHVSGGEHESKDALLKGDAYRIGEHDDLIFFGHGGTVSVWRRAA